MAFPCSSTRTSFFCSWCYGSASLFRPAALPSIFRRLSAYSADLRGFQSPGTASFLSAAITGCFPKSDYSRRSAVEPSCFPSSRFLRLDSGSFSQVRWSSQVYYPVEGFFYYESFSLKHRAYLMSVQSYHEPNFFAEASNHSCVRKTMQ